MSKRPNLLLVYPDEMRYDSLSVSGNPVSRTPAIDRLASQGAFFEGAYVSYPLCCPFRASLMTGKYMHQHGLYTNHYPLRLDQSFLPELLNAAGYESCWIGKWHLDGEKQFEPVPRPYRLGFKEFVGYSRGHNYLEGIYYRDDDPQPYRSELYEPAYQTEHVIDFMQRSQTAGKPFAAMLCYGLPHSPLDSAPPEYRNHYDPAEVPASPLVSAQAMAKHKEDMAKYYGLVKCVDDQMARLMRWLEEAGLAEDTLVVFVSDHGILYGEHGLAYKSSFHEQAMHVPLIMRLPSQIKAGTRIGQLVDPAITLFPTILDYCGIKAPDGLPGASLRGLIQGDVAVDPQARVLYQLAKVYPAAYEVLDVQERKEFAERGIRTKELVYVEKDGVPFALYDLRTDPQETQNLVNAVAYLHVVEEYRERLKAWMKELGDDWAFGPQEAPPDYQSQAMGRKHHDEVYKKAIIEKPF